MSEATPEPAGTETGQVEDGSTGTGTGPEDAGADPAGTAEPGNDLADQLAHWKAQSRKHETRAKDNAKAAKELADLKAAQMTESERIQAERDEAIRERDEARADHSRVMAAAAHDLPVEMIDDLGAGTDEEINDRAERWAGLIETRAQEIADQILAQQGVGRNGQQPGARPVESLRAGSAPSSGGTTPKTSDEWFRSLYQRD
jgi:hypothetical protein